MPSTVLLADVGGTHTRARLAAVSDGEKARLIKAATFRTKNIEYLKEVLAQFVNDQELPSGSLAAIVIGVPGRVSKDRRACAITQFDAGTFVDFDDLRRGLHVPHLQLLNDLECGVLGVAHSDERYFSSLSGEVPRSVPRTRFGLVMPGTGLGIGLYDAERGPLASEGGHIAASCDLSQPVEVELFRRIRGDDRALPSYHLLTRAAALDSIFRTIVSFADSSVERDSAVRMLDVVTLGERSHLLARWAAEAVESAPSASEWARESFALFGTFLGRAMQSIALAALPDAMYLGGSLLVAHRGLIGESVLIAFRSHTRHAAFLAGCPVLVATSPDLNLEGAMCYSEQLVRTSPRLL